MKRVLLVLFALMLCAITFASCGHEHEFGEWKTVKDASCTETGLQERVCKCGEKETKELPLLSHIKGEWVVDVEATCTEEGTKHQICSVCKTSLRTVSVAALGHTEVVDAAVAPTCTKTGLTEGKHCSVCEVVLVAQEAVAVIDHEYLLGMCSICAHIDEAYCQPIYSEMRAEMLCMDIDGVLESIKDKLDRLPSSYKDVEAIKEEFIFIESQEQIINDAIVNHALKWLLPENASDYYIDYEKVRRAYLNLVNNEDNYKNWDLIGLANNTIMGKNDEGNNKDFLFFVIVGEWSTRDGEYYFDVIEKEDNSLSFRCNLPNEKNYNCDYYYYIDGKNIGYEQTDDSSNTFNSYRIIEITNDYIKVFCYKNSRTYTLYSN